MIELVSRPAADLRARLWPWAESRRAVSRSVAVRSAPAGGREQHPAPGRRSCGRRSLRYPGGPVKGGVHFYRGSGAGAARCSDEGHRGAEAYYSEDQRVARDRHLERRGAGRYDVAGRAGGAGEMGGGFIRSGGHDRQPLRFVEVVVNNPKSLSIVASQNPMVAAAEPPGLRRADPGRRRSGGHPLHGRQRISANRYRAADLSKTAQSLLVLPVAKPAMATPRSVSRVAAVLADGGSACAPRGHHVAHTAVCLARVE